MDIVTSSQIEIFLKLFLAAFLGALIGLEREYKRKEAGFRTYSLVSLGAALFTIAGFKAFSFFSEQVKAGISFDPTRVIGSIAIGVGFIGAGLIIYRQSHIEGLTTAAGLWLAAGIGATVGSQLYFTAIFATLLAIGILSGLRIIEEKYFGKKFKEIEEKS